MMGLFCAALALSLHLSRRLPRRSLNISSNVLRFLPPSLDALSSLTRLDASRNRLEHLPPSIGGLGRLIHLDLHTNKLPFLPL